MLEEDWAFVWIPVLIAPNMEQIQNVIVLCYHLHWLPLVIGELLVHNSDHILVNAHCYYFMCFMF